MLPDSVVAGDISWIDAREIGRLQATRFPVAVAVDSGAVGAGDEVAEAERLLRTFLVRRLLVLLPLALALGAGSGVCRRRLRARQGRAAVAHHRRVT